ncbi:MAG: hypothetical protein ABIH92_01135 [Nanoarchaeota archaeon]
MKKSINLLGDYFLGVGVGLAVVGATLIFNNPLGILISGVIFVIVGFIVKSAFT